MPSGVPHVVVATLYVDHRAAHQQHHAADGDT